MVDAGDGSFNSMNDCTEQVDPVMLTVARPPGNKSVAELSASIIEAQKLEISKMKELLAKY